MIYKRFLSNQDIKLKYWIIKVQRIGNFKQKKKSEINLNYFLLKTCKNVGFNKKLNRVGKV